MCCLVEKGAEGSDREKKTPEKEKGCCSYNAQPSLALKDQPSELSSVLLFKPNQHSPKQASASKVRFLNPLHFSYLFASLPC